MGIFRGAHMATWTTNRQAANQRKALKAAKLQLPQNEPQVPAPLSEDEMRKIEKREAKIIRRASREEQKKLAQDAIDRNDYQSTSPNHPWKVIRCGRTSKQKT